MSQSHNITEGRRTQSELQEYIRYMMPHWIRSTIIKDMKMYARAANLPKQFLDGITLRENNTIVNTWWSPAKRLCDWFEFGTPRHWIQPKNPKGVLAWQAPGSAGESHGNAIYYQSGVKKGTWLFSKGHYVSGLPKTEAMHKGFDSGIIKLQQKIHKEIRKFAESHEMEIIAK